MRKTISVMVVEDSAVARELITDALNSDPRLCVVCAVDSAEKALRILPRLAPDVISMDIRLPGMSGIEATRRIMAEHPTPIVVVAADLSREAVNGSMEALRAGALTVVEKPTVDSAEAYRAMAGRLCDQFVNMSTVKLVRHRTRKSSAGCQPTARHRHSAPSGVASTIDVVAIAASTGGPPATARLLQGLGATFPVPILVVQHMGCAFLDGYTAWLNSVCDLEVGLATHGSAPAPGRVYVGPGRYHMTYDGGLLRLIPDFSDHGHVPSGDELFASLAASAGAHAIGVLLTGMGEDGARGLLQMRQAGAYTIGQDEATSAVYGMPAVALARGAVTEQLPLEAIAARIADLVARDAKAGARNLPKPVPQPRSCAP